MPKGQYQKRMNKGIAGGSAGGGSTSVSGGGTIPETVSAQTGNTIDTAGRHTHAVLASSNPGNHEVLLKTDEHGQLHLQGAELDQLNPTSVIFQEDGIAIIGGSLAVVPDSGFLAAAVTSAATTIDFGKVMTPGVFVIIRGVTTARNRAVEFLQIGSLVSGTTYNVTRDVTGLNATAPAWPTQMPFAVLGAAGAGRLWMTTKPARYWLSLQGATADSYTNVVGIGDLNGGWGYNAQTYGMALGEYGEDKANLTWDPTNGLRIRRHAETLIQLDNQGHAMIAGWELAPDHLAKNGVILNSAGYLLLGTGSEIIRLDAKNAHWRMWAGAVTGDDAPFGVTKAGAIKATAGTIGGWSLSQNSIVGAGMVLGAGGYLHAGDIEGGDVLVIDSSDDTHRLWAGATLKLDAPFAILKDGSIKATAGTVGGWTLSATGLYSGTGTDRVVLTVANPTYRFWAGAEAAAEAPFSVTKEGVIKASSGTVGGWTISTTIQKLTAGVGIILDPATPKIQIGNTGGVHLVLDGAAGTIGTSDYASGATGWQATQAGYAEFNNVTVRGTLRSTVFQRDMVQAHSGTLIVGKSAGVLSVDYTTGGTMYVQTPPGGGWVFETGDVVYIKEEGSSGLSAAWVTVTRTATLNRYNTVLSSGSANTFRKGTAVVNYGQSGQGLLLLTADLANGPYYDVQTHSGSPWTDADTKVRLGNLDGIVDADLLPSGFGLYADNVFLRGDIIAGGGAVTLNQYGIEIDADSGGNTITWTSGATLRARLITQGAYLNVLAFSGAARPTLRLDGDRAGTDAEGWANLYDLEGLYGSTFVGLLVGASGAPGAMLDIRGSAIFNEGGLDVDFRVEGDTDTHLLFVDASADRVGFGTNAPLGKSHTVDDAYAETAITERNGLTTDNLWASTRLLATKTTNMGDGFGPCFAFLIRDDADTLNTIAAFGAVRAGADNTGDIVFQPWAAGAAAEKLRIKSNGALLYPGNLTAYRNATEYTGYIYVPLASKLTAAAFDGGDDFSDTGFTKLDTSVVFGAPAGIKAALVRIGARDSAAHPQTSLYVDLSTEGTFETIQVACRPIGDDVWDEKIAIVNCDSNGDFYYRINASGPNTLNLFIEILGYWI